MGLPALQATFENLSAKTRKRIDAAERVSEVVSFPMGQIIKVVDGTIARHLDLRVHFIQANRFLTDFLKSPEIEIDDLDKLADVISMMKRVRQRLSKPHFADVEGSSVLSIATTLRSIETKRSADGRIGRRQAKRVEEIAELTEVQREKFVTLTDQAVALMQAKVADNVDFQRALTKAVASQSVDRFPIVNEYLAR